MPGRVVVQWDKDDCADMGIIKVDLLGLGMMAVLQETMAAINAVQTPGSDARRVGSRPGGDESRSLEPEPELRGVDLAHLPPDDPAVYRMLQAPTRSASSRWSRARRWRRCRV